MSRTAASIGGGVVKRLQRQKVTTKMKKAAVVKKAVKRQTLSGKAKVDGRRTRTSTRSIALPDLGEMELASGGVSAHGTRMIQLQFTNGAVVRLVPANLDASRTIDTRDKLVAWLEGCM